MRPLVILRLAAKASCCTGCFSSNVGPREKTQVMQTPVVLRSWWELAESQRAEVLCLQIDPQQLEFAGTTERAVGRLGTSRTSDADALAAISHGSVRAFLALSRGSRAPAWADPGAAVVSAMRVDKRHQGKGLGTSALLALPAWLHEHWPECTALSLLVDAENHAGLKAYSRAGFSQVGVPGQGRIGLVIRMSRPLHASLSEA
jgi:RimJ/RimL family protein N-acetyltransferase